MIPSPQSCAVAVAICDDVVDPTPVLLGVVGGSLVLLIVLIVVGVRRSWRTVASVEGRGRARTPLAPEPTAGRKDA